MLGELHAHAIRLIVISLLLGIPAAAFEFRMNQPAFRVGFIRMIWIWSLIDIIIGVASYFGQAPKDFQGLISFLKLNIGLDAGYMVIGGLVAWRAMKPYAKGMGAAVIPQGLLLLVLDLYLIYRLR